MGTTFLLLREQGLQCLTIKKSNKHIKFLEQSTHPWLPAFIAAYTLSYNECWMSFADKRSNGMSDWNKYKSQIVSVHKDSWSRPLQKIFTFRKCHCKYTAKLICLKHDAPQPQPRCHLGNTSSLSKIAQLKPINIIISLGTAAKGHTVKLNTDGSHGRAHGTSWIGTESIHPASIRAQTTYSPCPFPSRMGLCKNVTPKLLVCGGG